MQREALPDSAVVVRGGRSTPSAIGRAFATYRGGLTGVAVVSAAEQSIEQLAKTIPHRTITSTSVAAIRKGGGDVVPHEGKSPFFAVITGWRNVYNDAINEKWSREGSDMTHGRVPHLFADFNNADKLGRVRLNTRGTRDDLVALGITLYDGMPVILDDREEIVADAIVRHCPTEGWVAEVDWQAIENR